MTTLACNTSQDQRDIFGGVDTHADTHTAAAIDGTGHLLGHATFAATEAGYRALTQWLTTWGTVQSVGIEGTGSYGSGLNRHARSHGLKIVEVNRPDRAARRAVGKSDPVDAEAAARAALARTRTATPKERDGQVESLRNLRVVRRSAVAQRAQCQQQLNDLIVTAPDPVRASLRDLPLPALIRTCAALRPDLGDISDPRQAVKVSLRALARRHLALTDEITDLDALIEPLVTAINPDLLDLFGVGPDTAGQLLVTAGQNSDRVHSEAAFAMLCGVAPLPASSGRTHRHRLNRGGDRQANAALYRIVLTRLRWDKRTQDYMTRRTTEGLSKKDVIRCLKRMVAREIYYVLTRPETATTPPQPAA